MTFTVSTLDDEGFNGGTLSDETSDGTGLSLREALALLGLGGTGPITFDASLSGSTFSVTGIPFRTDVDLTFEAGSNTIGLLNSQGGNLLTIGTDGVTFTNNGLTLAIDASGTMADRVPTLRVDAHDVNIVNNGHILSTGYFGFLGDRSVGIKINGNDFSLTNGANASIVSQGRFAIESTNGTIQNAGLIEAADDTIRLYAGTIDNSGTIRTTGATDLNGAFEAPGLGANAISLIGAPAGYVAPSEGVVTINNSATGVIEGFQAAIRSSGGGVINNEGNIIGNSSALFIIPLAGSNVSFTLDNSGTVTRNGGNLGLDSTLPAAVIITQGLTGATITNSGTIESPDNVIVSYTGTMLTNTSTGVLDGNSDKVGNDAVAFRGAEVTDFPIFVTAAFPAVNPGLVSAQDGVTLGPQSIAYLGRLLQLPNSQIQTIQAQVNGAPGVIPLLDLNASLSSGFAIFQIASSGALIFPESVDIPSTDFGTIRLARQPDGSYIVTDLNDSIIYNVPEGNYNDVVTNDGQIIGNILTGMGSDTVTNNGSLTGEVDLGSGSDVFDGSGSAQGTTVRAGTGNDIITGGIGDDVLDGGAGIDRLNYDMATSRVIVNLNLTTAQNTGGGGTDTLSGFENLIGSDFNDILYGDAGDNVIDGGAGNDYIRGEGGNDTLIGGAGTSDWASYFTASSRVVVDLSLSSAQDTLGAGVDTLSGFENIEGSAHNDILTGDSGNNYIDGQAGADQLNGGDGTDILVGGAGNDTLTYDSGGHDTMDGGAGDDILRISNSSFNGTPGVYNVTIDGGSGDDQYIHIDSTQMNVDFDGGDGNDSVDFRFGSALGTYDFDMGAGDDFVKIGDGHTRGNGQFTLTLGAGIDTVVLDELPDSLTITDFATGNAGDVFLFNEIPALTGWDGASNLFADGYFSLVQNGADTQLMLDGDGGVGAGTATLLATFQNTLVGDFTTSNFAGIAPNGDPIAGQTIDGTPGIDDLDGTFGGDIINGLAGNDTINGFAGNDILNGGDGGDRMYGGFGDDVLNGGAGNDTLHFETGGNDTLNGDAGDDTLRISNSGIDGAIEVFNVTINGGTGNDRLIHIDGAQLNVDFDGGEGNDRAQVWFGNAASTFDLDMGAGDDRVEIGNGSTTGNGQFTLTLGAGRDNVDIQNIGIQPNSIAIPLPTKITITDFEEGDLGDTLAFNFADNINGWDGSTDPFATGYMRLFIDGADTLIQVRVTNAALSVDEWADLAVLENVDLAIMTAANFGGYAGFANQIFIEGDNGNDILIGTGLGDNISGFDGADFIDGLSGNDNLLGGDGRDVIFGNSGDDVIDGQGGNDYIRGGLGNDTLVGGSGSQDWVSYLGASGAVFVDLSDAAQQDTLSEGLDTLSGFENLEGSAFRDILFGDGGHNYIDGQAGNDYIRGGLGNDILVGGAGTSDWVSYLGASGAVSVDLSLTGFQDTLSEDLDSLSGFENLEGSIFSDVLVGDAGNNYIDGQAGNDLIEGGAGNDILVGGVGADTVSYANSSGRVVVDLSLSGAQNTQGAGMDTLIGFEQVQGSDFRDILFGNNGSNYVLGGAGNDYIDGGGAGDFLDGGAGSSDWVSYQSATGFVVVSLADTGVQNTYNSGQDIIQNFENLEGSNFNDVLFGDAGSNYIDGRGDNDLIDGGAGNDNLLGGLGNDTFRFSGDFGQDTVLDFNTGINFLQFAVAGLTQFSQLSVTQDGADTLLAYDGQSVRLLGVTASEITSDDVGFNPPPAAQEKVATVDLVSETPDAVALSLDGDESFDFKDTSDIVPIAEIMDDDSLMDVSDGHVAAFHAQLETLSHEAHEGGPITYVNEFGILALITPDEDAYWDMVG